MVVDDDGVAASGASGDDIDVDVAVVAVFGGKVGGSHSVVVSWLMLMLLLLSWWWTLPH